MSNWRRQIRQIVDGSAAVALGRFGSLAFSLVTVPVIARVLGPEGRGLTATGMSVFTVLSTAFGLGVPLTLRRWISIGRRLEDCVATGRLYAEVTFIPTLIVAVIAAHTGLGQMSLAERLSLAAMLLFLPLAVSWGQDTSSLVALKKYRQIGIMGIAQAGSHFVMLVVCWLVGALSVSTVLVTFGLSHAFTAAIGVAFLPGRGGKVVGFWSLVREGASLIGGQLADVASRKLDQVLALVVLGASPAGIYSAAATVGSLLTPVAQAFSAGSYSKMVSVGKGSREASAAVVRSAVALSTLCGLALATLSPAIIFLGFGNEFESARVPALVSVVGGAVATVGYSAAIALSAKGMGARMTIAQLVGLLVMVASAVPLGRQLDVIGISISSGFGLLVSALLCVRALGLGVADVVPRRDSWRAAIGVFWRSGS
jgi:O-antigen/teichoic acid export membrane protein